MGRSMALSPGTVKAQGWCAVNEQHGEGRIGDRSGAYEARARSGVMIL
ncbi:MAG: hypothetical protein AAB308_13490 [Nitrospirota bacterium]